MASAGAGGDSGDSGDGKEVDRQRPRQRPGADGGARRQAQRPQVEREQDYAALVGGLRHGDLRVVLRRVPGAAAVTLPSAAAALSTAQAPGRPDHWHAVEAPLTGIFYARPSPDEALFVTVGGHVDADQVVGLIESMKMYNDVTADVAGIVREAVAQNGELIEVGQPIVYIERGEGPQGPPDAG